MAENIYTCIGCGEKLSNEVLVCSKCGRKTLAGKKADFDKKWNTPEAKARVKNESNQEFMGMIVLFTIFLTVIIGASVAIFKDVSKERPKSKDDIKIEQLRFCRDLIRENLKDPDSYKAINSLYMQKETGIIRYSATNSFGGRVQEVYKCFDP